MKSIYIIGFMGSGKTTTALKLAQELKLPLKDTDQEVVEKYGRPISEIFEDEGEEQFRIYETKVLKQMPIKNTIISTGGGIIEKTGNVQWMKENGLVIYLKTPFNTIVERLRSDSERPLWQQNLENKQKLYKHRLQTYEDASHITVETQGLTLAQVVQQMIKVIK